MADDPPQNFIEAARLKLALAWESVQQSSPTDDETPHLTEPIRSAIQKSINSQTKTYRYVLPTQLLAKAVDPALDARCVQVASGLTKAFDARSLCHTVIVDFDRKNNDVLGGSPSPYLSNPLRIPALTQDHRGQQKNKVGYDDLIFVLNFAQANPEKAGSLLRSVLSAVFRRLALAAVVYAVPNRV
jgi:hypothetical protein